ncbi:rhomboid family intramembrane serine protease [Halobellus captivus]|uniref:rhomboid family intramembrane serine protease n=1 Tax=Halobellus captivus TaxID=2592614 RepID=UPI0011A5C4A0|nr:rhomboid family intramembrane serine protease [Halobellus captivus]
MRRVTATNVLTPFENGIRPLVAQHRALAAPLTDLLVIVVCGVYAIQAAQTALWNVSSVFETTNYVYFREPWLAWLLAPLLHGGLTHVVPNVLTLFAFGRIAEGHLPQRQFAAMVVVAAVGSILALVAWSVVFAPDSYVAVYGISGVVFAVGGFAVVHLPRHGRATDLELLATLFGVCAVALVGVEALTALAFRAPASVNVGHAVGLLVGVVTAFGTRPRGRSCVPSRDAPDEE